MACAKWNYGGTCLKSYLLVLPPQLPLTWTEEDVRGYFETFGPLVSVRVLPASNPGGGAPPGQASQECMG